MSGEPRAAVFDGLTATEHAAAEAVRVLTEAARRTSTVRDRHGSEHQEQADFAEFVTLAVAGAAANIGGIEAVLAGRPGSWEAEHVRQMLQSTVGPDGEHLMEHRTEPVRFVVSVDDVLADFDQWDLYDDADAELSGRAQAITAGSGERVTREVGWQLDEVAALGDRLDAQRRREWTAYGEALAANLRRITAEAMPGLQVPVEVEVYTVWGEGRREWLTELSVLEPVWEQALAQTPLPSGLAPEEYPSPAGPAGAAHMFADADRAAGRTPVARLAATDEPGAER